MYPVHNDDFDWINHDLTVESRAHPPFSSCTQQFCWAAAAHPSGPTVEAGSEPGQVSTLSQGQRKDRVRRVKSWSGPSQRPHWSRPSSVNVVPSGCNSLQMIRSNFPVSKCCQKVKQLSLSLASSKFKEPDITHYILNYCKWELSGGNEGRFLF